MTVTESLASWAHELQLTDVPPDVQRAAGRHLLDGLGAALAAARAQAADPAVRVATALGGPPEATILGTAVQSRRAGGGAGERHPVAHLRLR